MFLTHFCRKIAPCLPRLFAGLLGMVAFAAFTSGPLQADTPMFRGGGGLTGVYQEKLDLPLALLWRYTTTYFPDNDSAPAVVGNVAYFSSGRTLYAIDITAGELKWKYPDDAPLSVEISTSPAVADGFVFIGTTGGLLYAIAADTGKKVWEFRAGKSIDASPTVADGVIYVGANDGHVWALDDKTGVTVPTWKAGFLASDEITGAPAVSNGMVYLLSLDQVLHAVAANTSVERWNVRLPATVVHMAPVVSGDNVYVGNGPNLMSFTARTGVRHWTQVFQTDLVVPPAVTDDAIYAITSDSYVFSLEPRFGRTRWKTSPQLDFDVAAPPIVCGNVLLIGTTHGVLYALDTQTGAIKWTYKVFPSTSHTDAIRPYTNVTAPPVVSGQTLYVLTDDGTLSAFRSDALDTLPPTVSVITPQSGEVINGEPPLHFEAHITDEGSGVNPETVKFKIDDQAIPRKPVGGKSPDGVGFEFDPFDGQLNYDTPPVSAGSVVRALNDGRHTATITAADWKGNIVSKSWSFTIDNSLPKLVKKKDTNPRYPRRGGGGGKGGGSGG